jgi:diaminohydroxyphosphoribosylaminopyrimidine deaminase/5-amino-6-(5-phosphoribosylamino)uracil reductase
VAAPDGSSRWISSRPARVDAHRLRAAHDAVLVGSGAARADDPHLAVRHDVRCKSPVRVVLDARGDIVTASSRVADEAAPTIVVLAPDTRAPALPSHVELLRSEVDLGGRFDLVALLAALRRRGITTLLVEGGPTIAGAFMAAGFVDRIVAYVRPAILGSGLALIDIPDVATIADLRVFRLESVEVLGDDIRVIARAKRR